MARRDKMTTLKNKILIKVNRKLIFIISILMIIALNLFGEEEIEFKYYYYTNKIYHSILKTEIIPSEYVFITTNSTNGNYYSYLYNLKTKEKKLFYIYRRIYYGNYDYYYDINGNLTTNWTDKNMQANEFYEITNNRFGETFYNRKYISEKTTIGITKTNNYIQKAYKYSLTQPEIINKKDRGIYLFKTRGELSDEKIIISSRLCFQNEYYAYFEESGLLNYTNGRVFVQKCRSTIAYSYSSYDRWRKQWVTGATWWRSDISNTIYFQLNNKSLIKPTWQEFANNSLNYIKKESGDKYTTNFHYSKENTEYNSWEYKNLIDNIDFIGFIPIEEFEYYLLAD